MVIIQRHAVLEVKSITSQRSHWNSKLPLWLLGRRTCTFWHLETVEVACSASVISDAIEAISAWNICQLFVGNSRGELFFLGFAFVLAEPGYSLVIDVSPNSHQSKRTWPCDGLPDAADAVGERCGRSLDLQRRRMCAFIAQQSTQVFGPPTGGLDVL